MRGIRRVLEDAVHRGASDLHLVAGHPPIARVGGDLFALDEASLGADELERMLVDIAAPAQRAQLLADGELDLAYAHGDLARFRASYRLGHAGVEATFRVIPRRVPSLADLESPDVLRRLADRRSGLVLIAGPSSSGKTTTTAAMIDHVNRTRACHVLTIERPIEFVHEPSLAQITQREIGAHAPTFSAALRCAARDDADLVFVSELRTREDVELALRLADDGALVFANVPASGAKSAVDTLLRPFTPGLLPPARARLAECLAGVVVQHLLRGAGSTSRVVAREVLLGSPAVAALIRDGALDGLAEVMQKSQGDGMQTLDDDLERLFASGKISAGVALARARDAESLARALERRGPELLGAPPPSP